MEDVEVDKNGENVSKDGDDGDLTPSDQHIMDIDSTVEQPEAESESAIQFTHFESVAENETVVSEKVFSAFALYSVAMIISKSS